LGVSVILGISSITDPLLTNQGYYILDGVHRLFTMPFLTCSEERHGSRQESERLVMWQLSFSDLTEIQAHALRASTYDSIIGSALQRTSSWFPAVHNLIRATLPNEVWATALYDRDALNVRALHCAGNMCRVTVLGDACHPMSMFKGQGANQALEDAPLLTSMLLKALHRDQNQNRSSSSAAATSAVKRPRLDLATPIPSLSPLPIKLLHNTLRNFEREMVTRTNKKVIASRTAAMYLHSPAIFDSTMLESDELWKISGVDKEHYVMFLQALTAAGVNANRPEALEEKMVAVKRAMDYRFHGIESIIEVDSNENV
jgi:hypothetical protein